MDILASFPTVRIEGAEQVPEDFASYPLAVAVSPSPRPTLLRSPAGRTGVRIPNGSITVLAMVAVATWLAVWWMERRHDVPRQSVVTADASAATPESLTR